MTLRSAPDTIESLRATLQQLERMADRNSMSFVQLKVILLKRIAELELEQARVEIEKLHKLAS